MHDSTQLARFAAMLEDYARRHPGEAPVLARYRACLERGSEAFGRSGGDGHFTGSAWLVSRDGASVLLTHHRKLGRWLQLGGHADGDTDIARVALREAEEESGLSGLRLEPAILDLDCHRIPARGAEPEHFHYDVRFVVRATCAGRFVVGDESHALAWRDIAGLAADPATDASMVRMARKYLAGAN
jgi:8-oxo-dGTP pyrophosphatase MutT (NUDIX family)